MQRLLSATDAASTHGLDHIAVILALMTGIAVRDDRAAVARLDFVYMCGYAAIGAHTLRRLHQRAVRWLDRCSGVALLLTGSMLLHSRSGS